MKTTSLLARVSHRSATAVRRTAVTCSISAVLCLGLLIVGGTLHSVTATAASAEVCSGYAACSGNGYTTHGYQNVSGASYWTMDAGNECTNYVAYVESTGYGVPEPDYILGTGGSWAVNAAAHGVLVNNVPGVGAVAEWDGGEPGLPPPGHVAVVEAVGPNDSYIIISQQHISADPGGYDWMEIFAGSASWEPWPDHFIHFIPHKTAVDAVRTPDDGGYWVADSNGEVDTYGDAGNYGSADNLRLDAPIAGFARTPDGRGYWLVGSDGGVFSFGDAAFYGSAGALRLHAPIVGMAATPDGKGYWLVASDGGIFDYGDAGFYGSVGNLRLNAPVVGIAATPDGKGYWLAGADGGIFNFGDAAFYGSTGGLRLNAPVVGMAASSDGGGYWLVGSDGGVFNFGDAGFDGSSGSTHLLQPVVGITPTPGGSGYWIVDGDGSVHAFS
jgi:surface antigen